MLLYIYTDGAARGNPGESASGYHIYDEKHKLLVKEAVYNGIKTNNIAEYSAAFSALKKVIKEFGTTNKIILISDSKLMISQLNKEYKVKDKKLKEFNEAILSIAKKLESCKFENVPRENNYIKKVDKELNELLDKSKNMGKHTDNAQRRGIQKKL